MRWLFVGEALVLRKDLRIMVFIVLNPRWQCLCLFLSCLSADFLSICPKIYFPLKKGLISFYSFAIVGDDETRHLLFLLYRESRACCSGHPLIVESKDDFKNGRAPLEEMRFFYKRKRDKR